MSDTDDLDTDDTGEKGQRLLDRASARATVLYSVGLGMLGIAIIAIGIVGAFQH